MRNQHTDRAEKRRELLARMLDLWTDYVCDQLAMMDDEGKEKYLVQNRLSPAVKQKQYAQFFAEYEERCSEL